MVHTVLIARAVSGITATTVTDSVPVQNPSEPSHISTHVSLFVGGVEDIISWHLCQVTQDIAQITHSTS